MRALIIGGTGVISSDVSALAVRLGWDVTLFNRGTNEEFVPEGAKVVLGDAHDADQIKKLFGGKTYDVVANFIAYKPETVTRDVEIFGGNCGQYLFISSAVAYQKPSSTLLITESTPRRNPYSQYGRDKIACEEVLNSAYRGTAFPAAIVRPSWTYNRTGIPFIATSWKRPWSLVERLQKGLPILVPGDGTSRFTITHARDFAKGFVGLMGNELTAGHSFHITGSEALSWNQYLDILAGFIGVRANPVHVATDFILQHAPRLSSDLMGDKIHTLLFDNSKLKLFVPDFSATTSYAQGVRESLDYLFSRPELQILDDEYTAMYDAVFAAHGL